jgi:acyl carrier protein
LLGNLAELDSIGVVNVITLIEEQLGCVIEDDEINAEVFETLGSLVDFIQSKQCS